MKWIPKYQSGNKTKYASAAKDANTGESYDIYLQDGNTYDSQGNPVSVIRTPDTVITPNTYNQQLASKSYGTKEKGLETVYPEFDLITGAGLAKDVGLFGLSKLGSKWAKNKLLDSSVKNITKNLGNPTEGFQEVPLEDGFVYRTFTPSHGGFVKNNRVYNRNYGIGDVKVQNGKYYSVRQAHFNNPDKLWWDKFGHNRGQVVQVTKESNTQSLQDAANNGFSLNWGSFGKGYRLSDPIKTNEVINYKLDPITNTMVPSMPGKIINNKQTPSEIFSTPAANNYSYLKNTYTGFKGIKPKLNHHLQGDDAVKMFKEYGGTPIPEGSLNGDQLRKYVMEARERYGLMDNPNISDEEIAQALYKHTNELSKGSAAINSQGEPQLLFRGDTKAYTQLKDHISPEKLVENKGTMDNSLGTLFTGEFPGTLQDRFDTMGSSRYLDGWNFNPTINKWQWRGSGTESNFNKQEGYLMFSHPNYKLAQRGQYVGFKKAASTPEHPNDLNAFIVKTPAMRDATREISVLNDDFLVLQPTFKTNRFKWDTSKERIVDTSGKIDDVIEDNPNLGQRLAVGEHYTNVLQDAQKNNQGLLKSSRVGENGVTSDNSLREEHAHYSYFALPNFNKQNAKHILPYDLRIPRNWSDPNIFRIAAPIGMSLPFLNNSQK